MEKVVVITGAVKGIGKSCVKRFVQGNCLVMALDRDERGLEELKEEFPTITIFNCNVSDSAQVDQTFKAIKKISENIHVLINNAGIQRYGNAVTTTEQVWNEVMDVNVKSAFLCSQAAIPTMQASGNGVVINVSSVQAFISQQNVAAYTTSKSALLGLTRSIAVDFAPTIRCLAVCPGTVDTPMLQEALSEAADPSALLQECKDMHLTKEIGQADDVAALIWFLCSEEARFMTGQSVRIDGGLGITISGSPK